MFQNAVVCTDLTPGSDELVSFVTSLKGLGLRKVTLAHVVDVFAGETGEEEGFSDHFVDQTARLEAEGLRVRVDAPVGHPARVIEEIAEREDASVIVMGTRSRGLYEAYFSGSVSSDLLHITRRPVLLAPYHEPGSLSSSPACTRLLAHVLYPTDLCEAGERALNVLTNLTRYGLDRVTVMHVLPSDREESACPPTSPDVDAALREVRRHLNDYGVRGASERVEYGAPAECVLAAANSGLYSLVVLAAPRATPRARLGSGSVQSTLVAGCMAPMLLVPAKCRWAMETVAATTG